MGEVKGKRFSHTQHFYVRFLSRFILTLDFNVHFLGTGCRGQLCRFLPERPHPQAFLVAEAICTYGNTISISSKLGAFVLILHC